MAVGGGYELWVGDLNHQIKSDQKRGLVDIAFMLPLQCLWNVCFDSHTENTNLYNINSLY